MENASKALLIAGSILIAILLIAVGMRVLNSTSGTKNEVEGAMQATEIATFNNKFLPYIGKNKSKTDAINLLNIINAHNAVSDRKVSAYVEASILGDGKGTGNIVKAISELSNLSPAPKISIYIITYDGAYIKSIQFSKQK